MKFGIATKAIIFNKNNEVLLITKSDNDEINPNTVDIPGGRLEFGEKVEESLQREIQEETGLSVTIIAPSRVWGFTKNDLHLVGITFAVNLAEENDVKLSFEHNEFRWIKADEILNKDFPSWIKEEIEAAQKIKNNFPIK